MRKGGWIPLGLLLLVLPSVTPANDQKKLEELKSLSDHILTLEKSLDTISKQRKSLTTELKKTETQRSKLLIKIDKMSSQLKRLTTETAQLQRQQQQLESNKQRQQKLIFTQINTAYRLGREEPIKLLLNQEDPALLTRTFKYYDYFIQARAKKLDDYISTLQSIAETKLVLSTKTKQVSHQQDQLRQKNTQLAEQQRKRQVVVSKLNQQIQSDKQRLQQLLQEREHLTNVLKTLKEAIGDITVPGNSQPFSKLRGKLKWPVQGQLKHRYGSRRNSKMNWEGWLLGAKEGTRVNAIHHGRVIFSDYLRGQGLLIIIDHGEGYMSLYAHNQVLMKEAGDWVTSDETIARIGNSGGQQDHALYFEIRHKGKPTNPKKWLSKG